MNIWCTMIVFCFTFRARPTSVAWRHRAMRHRRPAVTAHLTSNNWPIRITRRNVDDSADVNGAFLRQRISCVETTRQKKGSHGFLHKSAQVCDAIWRLLQTVVYENQTETETKWHRSNTPTISLRKYVLSQACVVHTSSPDEQCTTASSSYCYIGADILLLTSSVNRARSYQ